MTKDFLTLDDVDTRGKRVLLRLDLNSPINPLTGRILDDTRLRRHIPTLDALHGAKVVILAHQSRPGKGDYTTLLRHSQALSRLLGRPVKYQDGLFDAATKQAIRNMKDGEILLLENTRFYAEEVKLKGKPIAMLEKTHIVNQLAPLFDLYINDAFAAAHRAQPTLVGFTNRLTSLAGRLMERELVMLSKALSNPQRPAVAIMGGAKVDDSIDVTEHLLKEGKMDRILTGGVVAEIFLIAKGIKLGKGSMDFIEKEIDDWQVQVEKAKKLLDAYPDQIGIPTDVAINDGGSRDGMNVDQLPADGPIMDIGLDTFISYSREIREAGTVMLNGPMGVFEVPDFAHGTLEVFKAVSECKGFTVIGGGHSGAVATQLKLEDSVDHISTGGGSLISFLSGKPMPVVEALELSKKVYSGRL